MWVCLCGCVSYSPFSLVHHSCISTKYILMSHFYSLFSTFYKHRFLLLSSIAFQLIFHPFLLNFIDHFLVLVLSFMVSQLRALWRGIGTRKIKGVNFWLETRPFGGFWGSGTCSCSPFLRKVHFNRRSHWSQLSAGCCARYALCWARRNLARVWTQLLSWNDLSVFQLLCFSSWDRKHSVLEKSDNFYPLNMGTVQFPLMAAITLRGRIFCM